MIFGDHRTSDDIQTNDIHPNDVQQNGIQSAKSSALYYNSVTNINYNSRSVIYAYSDL